jgi:two-component system, OmpR family, response regulator MprA
VETAPASILVVDDDPAIRELIASVLGDEGYQVETAQDGHGALAQINASPPHIVILDYAMPKMSGSEVLERLRAQGRENLPVIVVSASIYAERAVNEGATYYIAKPFALPELLNAVTLCLSRRAV